MNVSSEFAASYGSMPPAFGFCGKAKPVPVATPAQNRVRLATFLSRVIGNLSGSAVDRRDAVLRYVQPALTGLIDGSISTLAPLFAVAFATHDDWKTFLVGMAASIGAGVSMGFAEGLSDDGAISGRGSPKVRGLACGLATALGGLGHTFPYLLHDFRAATALAGGVVVVELLAISWIRARFMDTPMTKALLQIVLGGAIVLAVGVVVGSA